MSSLPSCGALRLYSHALLDTLIILAAGAGNPVRSVAVQNFKKGYSKHAAEVGYKQVSAQPWSLAELMSALQYLRIELEHSQGIPATLLARDGFLLSVFWQTKSRGSNAGTWRLENLKLPTGDKSLHLPLL